MGLCNKPVEFCSVILHIFVLHTSRIVNLPCKQWFLQAGRHATRGQKSVRSVQPGETTAAGQSRLGGHHESVTDISHRRMLTKILTARPPEMWPFSKLSHEKTRILQVLGCFQDV